MKRQMMRVISSPSSSTTGFATLIFFMRGGPYTERRRIIAEPGCSMPAFGGQHQGASIRARAAMFPSRLQPIGLGAGLGPGCCGKGRDQRLDARDDRIELTVLGTGEALADDVVDEGDQRPPITGCVDQEHGLVMQPELAPGDDLEGLV